MRDMKDVPNQYQVVQFISADYRMVGEAQKAFDEKYHVREKLLKDYPRDEYHFRRCLPTDHILNLVVRYLYWGRVTENDLIFSLQNLRTYCEKHGINYIVFPKPLCDAGFDWLRVYHQIHNVFDSWSGNVAIMLPESDEESDKEEECNNGPAA